MSDKCPILGFPKLRCKAQKSALQMGHFFYKEQKLRCKHGCNWDMNLTISQARLNHSVCNTKKCVAITEGVTGYWVGLEWDTFSALVRPPGPSQQLHFALLRYFSASVLYFDDNDLLFEF